MTRTSILRSSKTSADDALASGDGATMHAIADIYKQRWQVELLFKWINQNLKIRTFLGTNKNAVLTQVLAALCVYLLVALLKFQSKLTQSMQQITRLLHTNIFSKHNLTQLFQKIKPDKHPSPQMTLALVRR